MIWQLKTTCRFVLSMMPFFMGYLTWGTGLRECVPLGLTSIIFMIRAETRLQAAWSLSQFFAGSTLFLLFATLHHETSGALIMAVWIGALASVGVLASCSWHADERIRCLQTLLLFLLLALPPLGLFVIPHPLIGIASITPGAGLWGMAACCLFVGLAAIYGVRALSVFTAFLVVVGCLQIICIDVSNRASEIVPIHTHILPREIADDGDAYHRNSAFIKAVEKMRHSIAVFPEFVAGEMHPGLKDLWEGSPVATKRSSLLLGAFSTHKAKKMNEVLLFEKGRLQTIYKQKYPIPFAMWQPWRERGGFERGKMQRTVRVANKRFSLFLCYEMLLFPALLDTLFENPDGLVGLSSTIWSPTSLVRQTQENIMSIWALLLGVPLTIAHNK